MPSSDELTPDPDGDNWRNRVWRARHATTPCDYCGHPASLHWDFDPDAGCAGDTGFGCSCPEYVPSTAPEHAPIPKDWPT